LDLQHPRLLQRWGKQAIGGGDYYWKLVSFVSDEALDSIGRGLLTRLFWMGAVLFLLSSIPSYLIAQALVRRKLHRLELTYLANYDKLTGLPNRSLFMDRLNQALKRALRYQSQFALLFIDLDGFKAINDTFGHDAGDELLIKAAARLSASIRDSDTVARLGGDEFTVILLNVHAPSDPEGVAQKVISELSTPFTVKGNETRIGASVGISLFSKEKDTAETLLKNADNAMYLAKRQGKNTYQFSA